MVTKKDTEISLKGCTGQIWGNLSIKKMIVIDYNILSETEIHRSILTQFLKWEISENSCYSRKQIMQKK